MLSVIMLSVIMLSVIMLSVVMLSVNILSVVMLSVVMLNVVAPLRNILRKKINTAVQRMLTEAGKDLVQVTSL